MKVLTKTDLISLYGNIRIQNIKEKIEQNECISIENSKVSDFGNKLYELLQKEYEKIDYNWLDNNIKLKTTKVIVNNEMIKRNAVIYIYGKVIDKSGLPSENGKEYNFCIKDLCIEDLFKEIEELYEDYICDFDTIRDGLDFVFEKIEII